MHPDAAHSCRSFGFLLVEGFSLMSLASAVEPLRSANRLLGREEYRWQLLSPEGRTVRASNGFEFPTVAAAPLVEAGIDCLLACAGLRIDFERERGCLGVLRRAARRRLVVGSLSTATHLLARAGLLEGYRCTVHWESRPALEEEFLGLDCTGAIYEIDRDRMTCSGGTAAMDMMLRLIAERHGAELARAVANQFHHERIREARDPQRGGRLSRLAHLPRSLRTAVAIMEANIENPLPIEAIAGRVGSTSRQLERVFRKHLKTSPRELYIQLRIERAKELVLYSDMKIFDIAIAVGFSSGSHLSSWFRKLVGNTPSRLRNRA